MNRPLLLVGDVAADHDHHVVGQPVGLGQVVGDPHQGPAAVGQPAGGALEALAGLGVEGRGRLVHQQRARAGDQRAGQAHALRLAARQLVGRAVEERPVEPGVAQRGRQLVLVGAGVGDQEVVAHGAGEGRGRWNTIPTRRRSSSGSSALDRLAPVAHLAGGGHLQAVEQPQEHRLPRPRRSQHDGDARVGDGQLDSGEDGGTVDDQPHPHQLVEGRGRHEGRALRRGAGDRRRRGPRCPPGPPARSHVGHRPRGVAERPVASVQPGPWRAVRSAGPRRPPCAGVTRARELGDAPHRPHAVAPADLLALGVGAAVVADAHLVDPAAGPGHLGGDLGLEAEAVLLDVDRLDHLAAEGLVAGLHVGQVQVGEHVRQHVQEAVADGVPEVEHAVAGWR